MIEFLASDLCTRAMLNLFLAIALISLISAATVYLWIVIRDISRW